VTGYNFQKVIIPFGINAGRNTRRKLKQNIIRKKIRKQTATIYNVK
jgi:hypothetical protein